jgi:hypothetical protein
MSGVFRALSIAVQSLILLLSFAATKVVAAPKATAAGRICSQIQGVAVLASDYAFTQERNVGARIPELARQRTSIGYLPWFFPCDDTSVVSVPALFIANETLLAAEAAPWPGDRMLATVIGEACAAEPSIAVYGDLDAFFSDQNFQIRVLMRSVRHSLKAQCGQWPPSMRVRVQRRSVVDDPKRPATLRRPAGKVVSLEKLYEGKYFYTALDREIWADADPEQRNAAVDKAWNQRRSDPVEKARLRKEALEIYAIENPQEVKRLLQEVFSGAAEASLRNHCQSVLYGNVPEATASAMQACLELLSR